MKSREERGFEAAELRQASRGIGCKESFRRDPQLNPVGATNYYTTTGAATRDIRVCSCLAGTKQSTTSDMVIRSKLASSGTSATAGRSSRAESNQEIMNDTEVKVEVKREPGIDEYKGDDHGEDEQGGREEYNSA